MSCRSARPYAGYPPLVGSVAAALQADASGADPLQEARAQRLPRDVLAWEGGESDTERSLRARIPAGLPAPEADEPPRPWRVARGSRPPTAMQLARAAGLFPGRLRAARPRHHRARARRPRRAGLAAAGRGAPAVHRQPGARALPGSARRGDRGPQRLRVRLMERVREQPADWPSLPDAGAGVPERTAAGLRAAGSPRLSAG